MGWSSSGRARIGALLLSLTLVPLAAGHSQLTATISPPRIEKLVKPGSRVRDTVVFTNQAGHPVRVSVSFVDFEVGEEGEVAEHPAGILPSTLAPYLRLTPVSTVVAPDQRFHFRYSVDTPEIFTHLRAMVYFEAQPLVAEGEGPRVLFDTTMGIPLYIENVTATPGALEVRQVDWRRAREEEDHLLLTFSAFNRGERNVRPAGVLQVRSDGFSRTFDFNTGREVVLPGNRRQWQVRFGPVPGDELLLDFRVATSSRTSYHTEDRIAAAGD